MTPISRKPKCCIISRIVFKQFKDLWKLTTRSGEKYGKKSDHPRAVLAKLWL
jgi:hypothetical protein